SPDAKLAEIPWEVLRDGPGANGRYLVEQGYRITYLDSVRSLVYPPAPGKAEPITTLIANVRYGPVGDNTGPKADLKGAFIDIGSGREDAEKPAGGFEPWSAVAGGNEIMELLQDLEKKGRIPPVKKLPAGSEEEFVAQQRPAMMIAHTHAYFSAGQSSGNGL